MDWYKCSKTFVVVVKEKSFTKAADVLYSSQPAVSKQVSWLENQLDTQLLNRSSNRFELTESGESYYNLVTPLVNEWDEIRKQFAYSQGVAKGELRIAMPNVTGGMFIAHFVKGFLSKFPQIKIHLQYGSRMQNLEEKQIDVYISTEEVGYSGDHVSLKLKGPIKRLYASPTYLKKYGTPQCIEELVNYNCLVNPSTGADNWVFENGSIKVSGNFSCNNNEALIRAALEHIGIVYVTELFVKNEVDKGNLVAILPALAYYPLTIYVCYPNYKYPPLKTKVFIEFLENKFKIFDKKLK